MYAFNLCIDYFWLYDILDKVKVQICTLDESTDHESWVLQAFKIFACSYVFYRSAMNCLSC